jgi:error-prone DNA polymerase
VRQRPGSSEGVVFITIEDETGIANLVVWPDIFEKYRRAILSASMLGVFGRVQKEGDVVHIVARRLTNLSHLLASVGNRDEAALGHDQFKRVTVPALCGSDPAAREARSQNGRTEPIKVRTRDFR